MINKNALHTTRGYAATGFQPLAQISSFGRDFAYPRDVQNNAINKRFITYGKSILMSLNKRIIPGFVALLLFISTLPAAFLDTVVIKSQAMQKLLTGKMRFIDNS